MTKHDVILSIDIGLRGGIAYFDTTTGEVGMVKPMPIKEVTNKAGKKKNVVDLDRLLFLLEIPKVHNETAVVVFEDVHSFPGQGVVAVGTLLEQRGIIRGMATGLGYDEFVVSPKQWQKHFGLVPPKDIKGSTAVKTKTLRKKWIKEHSIITAKGFFPEWSEKIGNNDGISDALLIGCWYDEVMWKTE